ncbi:MAG: conjugal transfer protein TraN [Gammaproteobacteria bacterium]|nr:conjugal transfer protein TraN [Gammaproteobacteria bacterium]
MDRELPLMNSIPRLRLFLFLLIVFSAGVQTANACKELSKVCVDGPATKTVQGIKVYRACWKYSYKKLCTDNSYTNTCGPLEASASCHQIGSHCAETDSDGVCKVYTQTYKCGDLLNPSTGVIHVDTDYDIITDRWDDSQCSGVGSDTNCSLISNECMEPGETRNINGLDVYRDCWRYRKVYECLGDQKNDCETLEAATNCNQLSESCKHTSTSGLCTLTERQYQCTEATEVESPTVMNCKNQVYCLDGSCYSAASEPNQNFARAASYLAMIDEMAKDFDQDELVLFKGEALACDKHLLSYSNCCSEDGWGQDLGLDQCSKEEQRLAEKVQAESSHYVGSYCSKKTVLGVCVTKTKSYCAFNSKLGRIIQEQGRPQLGKGWGSAKRPDCSGITPQELQSLDFSQIDFSEFYEDVYRNVTVPDPQETTDGISARIQNYYDQNK